MSRERLSNAGEADGGVLELAAIELLALSVVSLRISRILIGLRDHYMLINNDALT